MNWLAPELLSARRFVVRAACAARLAELAYNSKAVITVRLRLAGWSEIWVPDDVGESELFLAYDARDRRLAIVFTGTEFSRERRLSDEQRPSLYDVFTDARLVWRRKWMFGPEGLRYPSGMISHVSRAWPSIARIVHDIEDQGERIEQIVLDGHSLGATAAQGVFVPLYGSRLEEKVSEIFPFEPARAFGTWRNWRGTCSRDWFNEECRLLEVKSHRVVTMIDEIHDWVPFLDWPGAGHVGEIKLLSIDDGRPSLYEGEEARARWRKMSPPSLLRREMRPLTSIKAHSIKTIAKSFEALAKDGEF